MTRVHFQLIAESIRQVEDPNLRRQLVAYWVPICRQSNDLFQAGKFELACEPVKAP
jgi:hypothetical protein